MKASEVVALWCEVFGSTDDVSNEAKASLVERVRAHANEMLERAAKVAEDEGITDIPPDASSDYERGMHETAVRIVKRLRALKE